jgi:predicted O-linked N-acetylglucosamine transferase (SPINDLY family)
MDWRLTDAVAEPPGVTEHLYTERLFRLPNSLWCYQPPEFLRGPVSALPALRRGHVTFASLNSYAKVGPQVVELWAAVLRAVPGSRIRLITVPEGEAQVALRARFAALGVAPERVDVHGRLGREDYRAVFDDVDIALDPFPCNGGTTTCDSLWMGLPVVALRGRSFLSRAALSVLTAAGCEEWAADDATGYLETCRALAADLPTLAATRAGLRARVAASPLTDAPRFARDVEAAYRRMWREWCDGDGQ